MHEKRISTLNSFISQTILQKNLITKIFLNILCKPFNQSGTHRPDEKLWLKPHMRLSHNHAFAVQINCARQASIRKLTMLHRQTQTASSVSGYTRTPTDKIFTYNSVLSFLIVYRISVNRIFVLLSRVFTTSNSLFFFWLIRLFGN